MTMITAVITTVTTSTTLQFIMPSIRVLKVTIQPVLCKCIGKCIGKCICSWVQAIQTYCSSSDTDMLPSAYDELLKCPGCLNRTANSLSCLAKADSAAKKCGLRYATQLAIDDLWKQFNKAPASATGESFHKGNALLQHMYTNEATSGDTKHKVHWTLPSAPHEPICKCLWARCAGFYDFTQNSVNSTFRATLSMFNKRLSTAKRETSRTGTDDSCGRLASGSRSGKKH